MLVGFVETKYFYVYSFYFIINLILLLDAEIDAVGGELMSTPLHWATRY